MLRACLRVAGYTYGQVFIEALKRAGRELTREGFLANLDQTQNQAAKDGKFVTVTGYITLK